MIVMSACIAIEFDEIMQNKGYYAIQSFKVTSVDTSR